MSNAHFVHCAACAAPFRAWVVVMLTLAGLPSEPAFAQSRDAVVVNGVALGERVVGALESAYATRIAPGRYWYDARSGLWGREGGMAAGRIEPGMNFGAPLAENASGGRTWVVVNGRRLPAAELAMLQSIVGPVVPGRYWLDAQGNAGFEGGPPLVNVVAAARHAAGRGAGGWNRNTLGGNWGGDGDCSYYSHPDGPSVMIGAC